MGIVEKLGITDCEAVEIWSVWAKEWHNCKGEFDTVWYGYSVLEDRTGVNMKKLKAFMKTMRDSGFAETRATVDGDYRPCGSGTFLIMGYEEKSWLEIKALLNNAD